MSKYYRESVRKLGEKVVNLNVVPVEVDDIPEVREAIAAAEALRYLTGDPWHPASKPPTSEDFEPTGEIQLLWKNRVTTLAVKEQLHEYSGFSHWRKITPPKP